MTSPSLRLASGGRGPARRTPCGWPCLLPGHVFGRPLDRLDDVVIAGAPAEVAFQLVADLLLGGARIALEELGLDLVTVRLAVDGHLDWQFHHSTSGIRAVCCGAPAQ